MLINTSLFALSFFVSCQSKLLFYTFALLLNQIQQIFDMHNQFFWIHSDIFFVLFAAFTGSAVVLASVPPILRVARAKNLFDSIDERKIHSGTIPPLGGVALFIGFVLASVVATQDYFFTTLKYIFAAIMLLFFVGLKDDLMIISAWKKFLVQVVASLLLITMGDVRITSFQGMMGISAIHSITSICITLFVMLVIINAFNLIDGIDGLASGLGILAASVFGVWFYLAGFPEYAILSFALVGSLSVFFLYNVFGHRNKLFLGDSGSLVLGLVLSVFLVKFNELNLVRSTPFSVAAAPSVSFAIVIVPLIDTLRVMSIRLMQGKSPFLPDKNHIHHRLLTLMPNHFKVTLTIIAANALLIGFSFLLNYWSFNVNVQFILVFITAIFLASVPSICIKVLKVKKTNAIDFAKQHYRVG